MRFFPERIPYKSNGYKQSRVGFFEIPRSYSIGEKWKTRERLERTLNFD